MSPSGPATAWASRAVPQALTAPKLAALVDRSLDAVDGLLFTATPREELDEIGRWQQLKDQAFAGQLRAIIAAHNRATDRQRPFAGDEVALALGCTPTTGGLLVQFALAVGALPGLLEAVEASMLTERHLRAVMAELDTVTLSLEQRQAIVLIVLARFSGQTPGELTRLVKRLILTVDRAAARARQDLATARRRVRTYGDVDGQGVVVARGPLEQIAAIKAALKAGRAAPTDPGEQRTADEREFDLFVALLTGGIAAGSWHAQVVVPFHTAAGGDLELAELPGLGPILPGTARDLLDLADTVSQVAVDEDGTVIAVGDPISHPTPQPEASRAEADDQPQAADRETDATAEPAPVTVGRAAPVSCPMRDAIRAMTTPPTLRPLASRGYRPNARLARFVATRDQTCTFPGCHRRVTDKDHRIPWPLGPTDPANLHCLCRHHHRAKQAAFTVELTDDGDTLWTTRGGWQFLRRRQGF